MSADLQNQNSLASTHCDLLTPYTVRYLHGSTLIEILTCRLFHTEPFPYMMLTFHQLTPHECIAVKFKLLKYHRCVCPIESQGFVC